MLKAPFPYFGGKSKIANEVWARFGDVKNYVEPFCGSAAMLLARPDYAGQTETINDADGLVSNFYRALQAAPDEVAHFANWPVNEADLHARNYWLTQRRESLTDKLMGDPDYFDAKIAGWWVWGFCASIGNNFCSNKGPWIVKDGLLVKSEPGKGIKKSLPFIGQGRGINRQLPEEIENHAAYWLEPIAKRLRRVRVACGDWQRVCGPTITFNQRTAAIFFDPPYATEKRHDTYHNESYTVAHDVREWCKENGDNPLLRIALCGYEGEHENLELYGWKVLKWKATGGYGNNGQTTGRNNAKKERVWFSPHCLNDVGQVSLF
jgi:site-specific DNA-adenine methylase